MSSGQPAGAVELLVYSVEEAAVVLGIGRSLAFALVARGELPTVRLGRRRVIPKHLLLDWLSARSRASMGDHPMPAEDFGV